MRVCARATWPPARCSRAAWGSRISHRWRICDARRQALAQRISIEVRDAGNPNALTPIEVEIGLHDGARHTARLDVVLGNPAKPLSKDDQLRKFRRNCQAAARPLPSDTVERLIERFDRLEEVDGRASRVADLLGCVKVG